MYETIASMKLSDVLKRPPAGEPVNVHVVAPPREPVDDFAAMRRLVHGDETKLARLPADEPGRPVR